jgi:integrase/recombinase XerD
VEWRPVFECHVRPDGEHVYRVGHALVDEFLEFVVGRARPNTVRAYAQDLSVFFRVVKKDPTEVRPKDVMAFVTAQRRPKPGAENVVRIADGSAGLSAATIKRRLAVTATQTIFVARSDCGWSEGSELPQRQKASSRLHLIFRHVDLVR